MNHRFDSFACDIGDRKSKKILMARLWRFALGQNFVNDVETGVFEVADTSMATVDRQLLSRKVTPNMFIMKLYRHILYGTGLLILTLAPLSFARERALPLSKKDVPRLLEELKSRDPNLKCSAAGNISRVEPIEAAKPSIPLLFNMLKSKDQCGRETAIEALGYIAPDDNRVFYSAVSLLDDATFPEKWRAANTLTEVCCNKKDSKCEKEIVSRLSNSVDREVLTRYVTSLRCFGEKAIPTLNKTLYHSDKSVRVEAAFTLGYIVSPSSSDKVRMQITNILKKRLKSADPEFSETIKIVIATLQK
jgi:hypothetical protein